LYFKSQEMYDSDRETIPKKVGGMVSSPHGWNPPTDLTPCNKGPQRKKKLN